jgi:SulP family sulfate permease
MTKAPPAGPYGIVNDAWGGLAAMLVALPSSIAFGVLVYTAISPVRAGEGALAGILGAAALGIVAPLVSRNGGFITAPCAPAAAVMSGLALELAAAGHSPDRVVLLLAVTALLSALLQLLYGVVGAGRLIKFVPYQVVSGYLSGVAVIIAVGQLPKLLGLPKDVPLARGLVSPQSWSWVAIGVGAITIATMALAPRLIQKIPAPIIGLLSGIAAYFALAAFDPALLKVAGNPLVIGLIDTSGSLVDTVMSRFAALGAVRPADIGLVLVSASTLSVLLSIDTLKTGVVLDALVHRRHDSNRELIGQGVANAAAVFVGGMPGAGTLGATLVNINSGGRSKWSGVIEGAFVVAAFAMLGALIAWVPIGALAGLLLAVAWRMFDRSMFRLALQPSTRLDFAVIATVVIVAQFGLIAASLTGIGLAVLLFIRDQARSSVIVAKVDLRGMRSKRRRSFAESALLDRDGGQAAMVRLHGNLFFGTADQLFSELEKDLATLRYLLVDLRRVQSMDFTAAHMFEQMNERLQERDGALLFSGMPSNLPTRSNIEKYLAELGLVTKGGGIRVFETRDGALEWMEERILEGAGWTPQEEGPPLALAEMELFAGLAPGEVAELAGAVEEMTVPAGGRLLGAGDRGDAMFLVRTGRLWALLPVEGGKRHHLATFGTGDFFGELAFIDRQPRSADVEAVTPASLYVLSRGRFDDLNPALCGKIFERISLAVSRRLRVADTELRALEER